MFAELFTLQSLFTLLMLVLLQAVLGFDNLLYISIESKRVEASKQSFVRKFGIALAIVLRIALLFAIYFAVRKLQRPIISFDWGEKVAAEISIHSLIVLGGGIFVIYTAIKEIHHMISYHDEHDDEHGKSKMRSLGSAITWIIIMNLVFSFDSILSAIALTGASHEPGHTEGSAMYTTHAPLVIMALAVIISGILMIVMTDHVSNFLQKNRMYEILGLFVLLIVGVMLITDGGHLAHVKLFGNEVQKMSNTTFYFVIGVLVLVDIVQGRYQKKLAREQDRLLALAEKHAKETDGQKENEKTT